MPVAFTFQMDDDAVEDAKSALRAGAGPAWFDEVGLEVPVTFKVNGISLLPPRPGGDVLAVGPDGRVVGSIGPALPRPFRLPLLNVAASGGAAVREAIRTGQSTWQLAGGGTISFQQGADGRVRIATRGVSAAGPTTADVAASELEDAFGAFEAAADAYITASLPELIDRGIWIRPERAQ